MHGGVDDFLHKLRGQETKPFHMRHIANGERGWCRIHSDVWVHSIICLQSLRAKIYHPDPLEIRTRPLVPILQRVVIAINFRRNVFAL